MVFCYLLVFFLAEKAKDIIQTIESRLNFSLNDMLNFCKKDGLPKDHPANFQQRESGFL